MTHNLYKILEDIEFVDKPHKKSWCWKGESNPSRDCRNLVKELRQQAIRMLKFKKYKKGQDKLLREFFSIELEIKK